MYGLLIAQDTDIKEDGFCNVITKTIFMSLNGLNLSNYGYIMSMYGFSDTYCREYKTPNPLLFHRGFYVDIKAVFFLR
jgi:hypothetical protein